MELKDLEKRKILEQLSPQQLPSGYGRTVVPGYGIELITPPSKITAEDELAAEQERALNSSVSMPPSDIRYLQDQQMNANNNQITIGGNTYVKNAMGMYADPKTGMTLFDTKKEQDQSEAQRAELLKGLTQ